MKRFTSRLQQDLPFLASIPAVIWQCLFMLAPVAIILYFSVAIPGMPFRFTVSHYLEVADYSSFKTIARSLFLSIMTAVSCLICAYPIAYYLALQATRFKKILLFLLTLPFWVNYLVKIYAWYFLLEYHGLINLFLIKLGIIREPLLLASSLIGVYIVMVYCYLPFMIMPLYNVLEKIDKRLLDASADLGANPWQTFLRVTLPLSMPGIRTGFLLVMIPAFGEFVIPALLGGSKYMMVGSLISYYFLVARDRAEGSAFTNLSWIALIVLFAMYYAVQKLWRMHTKRRMPV